MRHVGNDDLTMFAIVNMMRITGVVISKKSKCAEQTVYFEKFQNTVNPDIHCVQNVGIDYVNYVCNS